MKITLLPSQAALLAERILNGTAPPETADLEVIDELINQSEDTKLITFEFTDYKGNTKGYSWQRAVALRERGLDIRPQFQKPQGRQE